MRRRYILAPEAARDLAAIWNYIRDRDTPQAADRATSVIRSKMAFLATTPNAGHVRLDLTRAEVRFFPVVLLFDRLSLGHKTTAGGQHYTREPEFGAASR